MIPLEDRPFQSYKVEGQICIRDIWKNVELTVKIDPNTSGEEEVRAQVTGVIDRFDFGVLTNWPTATVGKDITLRFDIVANTKSNNAL